MDLLGTNHKLSTAFHPQTDGQIERTNSTIEQYLRHYVDYKQTNWVSLLPVAQFAWCHVSGETLKTSPFYANYGFEPKPYGEPKEITTTAELARIEVRQLKGLQETLAKDIRFFAERAAVYANKKRIGGPTLKKGDKVYLLRRNIKTTRPSSKLDHKKLGPFKIKMEKGPVNYELDLPNSMKIHPVFHISLLEPAPRDAKTIIPDLSDENEGLEYEIEKVIDMRETADGRQYLIKWKGFGESDNTWEPEDGLSSARQAVRRFLREGPSGAHPKTRRSLDRRRKKSQGQ